STISQLGYMFLALGSATGTRELATLAVIAAIFHLVTHAFFKALLFLSSGSVMHAMGGVIDMRRLGGLRRLMPYTHAAFLCGAAALAGIPLLSGFWSKDEILAAALDASHAGPHAAVYLLLFLAGLVTAGLTAFYTFRAYFMTFWGPERIPEEAGRHAHESPPVMTVPLMVLAVGAVLLGILIGPTHRFAHFLAWTPGLTPEVPSEHNWVVMIGGSLFALGGVALAWLMYAKQPDLPGRLARAAQGLYQASLNKFYLDELYDLFFVSSLNGAAEFLRLLDTYLVDGLVDLIGQVPRLLGALFRPIQNGLVQFYALAMVLGVAVFLIAWFLRW
ncbi:MAG TPA: proton-conducting transporter membrane subunit, partial [Gemmataceae bacterium]|nr:proton-conducting transporter membrane subunit [Gemmataceae bacterium]